jgi:hypothetical protein
VEPTKEDDLDRPDTIAGPGALILTVLQQAVMAVGTDFSAEKSARQSLPNFASVRISAAASAAQPMPVAGQRRRVTYATQTLPARVKENSVPLTENATAFS